MRVMDQETVELAKVCFLYYRKGLGQKEIANYIGKSSMSISRMLKKARELGIVEVRLNFPCPTDYGLETQMKEVFPAVEEFVVFNNNFFENIPRKRALGEAAAYYIPFFLHDSMLIGIGAGETLASLSKALLPQNIREVEVVQLTGILGRMATKGDAPFIAHDLAEKLNARGYFAPLPNPFILNKNVPCSKELTQILGEVKSRWDNLDLAIIGIGTVEDSLRSTRGGYISRETLSDLKHAGAVGDILLHFFDINGRIVSRSFDNTVTSIAWEQLKAVPTVIAVAGGKNKAASILGALNSGIINILISDQETSKEVLALVQH